MRVPTAHLWGQGGVRGLFAYPAVAVTKASKTSWTTRGRSSFVARRYKRIVCEQENVRIQELLSRQLGGVPRPCHYYRATLVIIIGRLNGSFFTGVANGPLFQVKPI
jgi:hypothetical protein